MTTKLFGEPVQRVEDAKLVTGGAHYLDDLGHDALGAAFVRSPHAHARVTDIDITGALEVDGLVAVYTYEDLGRRPAARRAAAAADPAPGADTRRAPATRWRGTRSTTSASRS